MEKPIIAAKVESSLPVWCPVMISIKSFDIKLETSDTPEPAMPSSV